MRATQFSVERKMGCPDKPGNDEVEGDVSGTLQSTNLRPSAVCKVKPGAKKP
jgi:hypothetical protein